MFSDTQEKNTGWYIGPEICFNIKLVYPGDSYYYFNLVKIVNESNQAIIKPFD